MPPLNDGKLGPWMTAALVVGSIIGAGIFMLPVSLAPYGGVAVVGWIISGLGALCIAFALARLARTDGAGIQAYIEREFGPTVGFLVTWNFCVSQWATNAALAIAAASAVSHLAGPGRGPSVASLAIAFIAVLAMVNAMGARSMGRLAVLTTLLKLLPLLAAILLWLLVSQAEGERLEPLAAMPMTFDTISGAVALTLFALTGFENATAPVDKIRDAPRNLPRAILFGTAFVALLYLLSSTSVLLLLTPAQAAASSAPFADALATRWGETAAILAALGMGISAFGGLNGGIMVTGELGYSMALRGDLPKPLARTRRTGTPVISQLVSAGFAMLLVLANSSRSAAGLFTFVILLSTVSVLYVYLAGCLAVLKQRAGPIATLVVLAGTGFSLFAFYGSGWEANAWGLVLMGFGLLVRTLVRLAERRRSSREAEAGPAALPE